MTDASWEALSNQAVAVAGVVYFLALVAHLVEWSAAVGATRTVAVAASVERRRRHGRGPRRRRRRHGPGGSAPRPPTAPTGSPSSAGSASCSPLIAVAVHGVALVSRGMAADPNRVPWGNMYEFTLAGTFVVALLYAVLYQRMALAWMAPIVIGFVTAMLMVAVLWLYDPVAPLTEALNSPWLVIHVMSAILATGAFTLGGITSAVYLVKLRWPSSGLVSRAPSLAVLDRVAYRIHAFAFPVWTFAVLITGPIWAHQAWSAYWSWDPKEVWAFITWVVYAAYLHARATAGWKGRNAAILALVGVATLWFNFVGINYFSSSSQHSYANSGAPVIAQPLDR